MMNLIDYETLDDILKCSNECSIVTERHGNGEFKVVKNILNEPEVYTQLLLDFPAVNNDQFSPGYRQDIPPWAAKFITQFIAEKIYGEYYPARVYTNIYSGDMMMYEKSNHPHSDPFQSVWNIWLNKNCAGGTAFWSWKGKNHISELTTSEIDEALNSNAKSNVKVPWENFEGNSNWKLECLVPMEYNTMVLYNGGFFHSPYVKSDWYLKEYRYTLVGMGETKQ